MPRIAKITSCLPPGPAAVQLRKPVAAGGIPNTGVRSAPGSFTISRGRNCFRVPSVCGQISNPRKKGRLLHEVPMESVKFLTWEKSVEKSR